MINIKNSLLSVHRNLTVKSPFTEEVMPLRDNLAKPLSIQTFRHPIPIKDFGPFPQKEFEVLPYTQPFGGVIQAYTDDIEAFVQIQRTKDSIEKQICESAEAYIENSLFSWETHVEHLEHNLVQVLLQEQQEQCDALIRKALTPVFIDITGKPTWESNNHFYQLSGGSGSNGPPRGGFRISGSSGSGSGGGYGSDFTGGSSPSNPLFLFFFGALLFFIGSLISKYGFEVMEKALMLLQNFLKRLENKKNFTLWDKFYLRTLKLLVFLIAFLTNPEAFALVLRTFGSAWVRYLFRSFRFFIRYGFLAFFFFGTVPYFLAFYKRILPFLSPMFEKVTFFLAGSKEVALPVLFLEQLIKVIVTSIVASLLLFILKKFFVTKRKIRFLLIFAFGCLVFYGLLVDVTYIRRFSLKLATFQQVKMLIHCQLGRFCLLIGSTFFVQSFDSLPQIPVFYILFVYSFGVYHLAFSASPNLFI